MLKRAILSSAAVLVMSGWIYSQAATNTGWKTFEDKKLGVSFSYPSAGTASLEKSAFDRGSFTVWVKTERTATTDLWWDFYLSKKPGRCSDTYSKPVAADIPTDIPKTKTIGKAMLALSVDTTSMEGFGDNYASLGLQYHGVILDDCWNAGYNENVLNKAPKPDAKVLAAMRADFLQWVDSINIRVK